MDTSELKLQLFRQIDGLDKNKLNELSGIVLNFIHGHYGMEDWENLSEIEKQGIMDSIKELDSGGGVPHETVMQKAKNKFINA